MEARNKQSCHKSFMKILHEKYITNLERRLLLKKKTMELKSQLHANSHSLLWVWEFSKKAVLICFIFYVIVQVYAMCVMVIFSDFSYLGDLINKTGEIVENCVFAYLVKAGLENIPKIWLGHKTKQEEEDETVG